MNTDFSGLNRQRGVVLVVAMVMLLLLTVIGLSSMRGTALQEAMASNLREGSVSYQAAEAALRAGEQDARDKFTTSIIGDLDTGIYGELAEGIHAPSYTIVKLATLRTSTDAMNYDEENPEGVLVRIEGSGADFTVNTGDQPTTQTQLRSTYLFEQ